MLAVGCSIPKYALSESETAETVDVSPQKRKLVKINGDIMVIVDVDCRFNEEMDAIEEESACWKIAGVACRFFALSCCHVVLVMLQFE